MHKLANSFCLSLLIAILPAPLLADSEIVVATRYLQPSKTSHSHLYLYSVDGKLLRQLTNDDSGQDMEPRFSPDGTIIVFTRDKGRQRKETWSVEPRGKGLKRLKEPPNWYLHPKGTTYFTNTKSTGVSGQVGAKAPHVKAPDGSVELVLELTQEEQNSMWQIGGEKYILKDIKTGKQWSLGKLPGFEGLGGLLQSTAATPRSFLFDGPLKTAFLERYFGSTDGSAVYALDTTKKRLVRLSTNWAVPIPLPGDAAFLTFSENRYVPIPKSQKTANCSYIDHWDSHFNRIRYGRDIAAVCYGASIYRPGKSPAVITIRKELY